MESVKQPVEKKGQVTKPQAPDIASIDQGGGVVKGLIRENMENYTENYVENYVENLG